MMKRVARGGSGSHKAQVHFPVAVTSCGLPLLQTSRKIRQNTFGGRFRGTTRKAVVRSKNDAIQLTKLQHVAPQIVLSSIFRVGDNDGPGRSF